MKQFFEFKHKIEWITEEAKLVFSGPYSRRNDNLFTAATKQLDYVRRKSQTRCNSKPIVKGSAQDLGLKTKSVEFWGDQFSSNKNNYNGVDGQLGRLNLDKLSNWWSWEERQGLLSNCEDDYFQKQNASKQDGDTTTSDDDDDDGDDQNQSPSNSRTFNKNSGKPEQFTHNLMYSKAAKELNLEWEKKRQSEKQWTSPSSSSKKKKQPVVFTPRPDGSRVWHQNWNEEDLLRNINNQNAWNSNSWNSSPTPNKTSPKSKTYKSREKQIHALKVKEDEEELFLDTMHFETGGVVARPHQQYETMFNMSDYF